MLHGYERNEESYFLALFSTITKVHNFILNFFSVQQKQELFLSLNFKPMSMAFKVIALSTPYSATPVFKLD